MLKAGEEWVFVDGNVLMVRMSKVALMGADVPRDISNRKPTEAEIASAVSYLNEQTSYAITLFCRNDACKSKGSWIQRSKQDAEKNAYICETCSRPMSR